MRRFNDHSMPLFFKLWFGFVALIAVSMIGLTVALVITMAADPAGMGRFAGEIVRGFDEARQ
jgi:hypothetical protein